MFERHLYNEEFFKFVREVGNLIRMPELTPQNVSNYIYQGYKDIPEKSKLSYLTVIKILANLIYSLMARANDNSVKLSIFKSNRVYNTVCFSKSAKSAQQ